MARQLANSLKSTLNQPPLLQLAAAGRVMRHSSNSHATIEQSRSNSPKHGKRCQRQEAPHHPGGLLSSDQKHNSWPRSDEQTNSCGEGREGVQMQGPHFLEHECHGDVQAPGRILHGLLPRAQGLARKELAQQGDRRKQASMSPWVCYGARIKRRLVDASGNI